MKIFQSLKATVTENEIRVITFRADMRISSQMGINYSRDFVYNLPTF